MQQTTQKLSCEQEEHSQVRLRPGCKPIRIEAGKVEGAVGGGHCQLLGCRCPVAVLRNQQWQGICQEVIILSGFIHSQDHVAQHGRLTAAKMSSI